MHEENNSPTEGCASAGPRFMIGEYEFRYPDYIQIKEWGGSAGMSPEQVVNILDSKRGVAFDGDGGGFCVWFSVVDGHIKSLILNLDELPVDTASWVEGLRIDSLMLEGTPPATSSSLRFPSSLRTLIVHTFPGVSSLDLSGSPNLQELDCGGNDLKELDLSYSENMVILDCWGNQLTDLDLSCIPKLEILNCSGNHLDRLDLAFSPNLKELDCGYNGLTYLDLSCVPELIRLVFRVPHSHAEFDLSKLSELRELDCALDELTELDLSGVSRLRSLYCPGNRLQELDLSEVPELEFLVCSSNDLAELDVSFVPRLRYLDCSYTELTDLDVSGLRRVLRIDVNSNVRVIGGLPLAGSWINRQDTSDLERNGEEFDAYDGFW